METEIYHQFIIQYIMYSDLYLEIPFNYFVYERPKKCCMKVNYPCPLNHCSGTLLSPHIPTHSINFKGIEPSKIVIIPESLKEVSDTSLQVKECENCGITLSNNVSYNEYIKSNSFIEGKKHKHKETKTNKKHNLDIPNKKRTYEKNIY
ncbi:hypothetical protein cand_003610 [Cryptosporidium andersoni]|uniref:Uncharacterized protein n=1 Tax=Cryptosporidium andersoni TaxID=117008 RepID=A0A1J4MM61_9CRYT|nr:hypothetical protein cand_003610 [Cryptosporidium andersoni]